MLLAGGAVIFGNEMGGGRGLRATTNIIQWNNNLRIWWLRITLWSKCSRWSSLNMSTQICLNCVSEDHNKNGSQMKLTRLAEAVLSHSRLELFCKIRWEIQTFESVHPYPWTRNPTVYIVFAYVAWSCSPQSSQWKQIVGQIISRLLSTQLASWE